MAALLRRVNIPVKSIYQVYPKQKHEKVQDPAWIELCGKKGWIALSGDKRIEKNVENRTAVIKHKVKVFILTDTNSLPEEWAAAVIVGRDKMASVIGKNEGPFFSIIQKRSRSHVSHARFPQQYLAKGAGDPPAPTSTEVTHGQESAKEQTGNPAGLQANSPSGAGNKTGDTETAKEKGR